MNYSGFKTLMTGLLILLSLPAFADISFLTLSDVHYGGTQETDAVLWQNALQQYEKHAKEADFILFLGDFTSHYIYTSAEKSRLQKKFFHELYKYNLKQKPIFYIAGNNDSLVGNYQPFSKNCPGESCLNPLNQAVEWGGKACAHCDGLLIDDSHLFEKGYYSSYTMPGNKSVILISLNATQFVDLPWWRTHPNQHEDADEQLIWLKKQLQTHHANQLLIAMHEPPGKNYQGKQIWKEKFLIEFIKILDENHQRYQEISLLTSHTHYDELRRIRLKHKTIYAYSTPSISRDHGNNSAMKVFHLSSNKKIKNTVTFYAKNNRKWMSDFYVAPDDIFGCNKNMVNCLDALKDKQICDSMKKKYIFGAKNPKVDEIGCEGSLDVLSGIHVNIS